MTRNEEKNIEQCLRTLRDLDEVFVVDSGSTDRTCEIAKSFGASIVPFEWDGKYPKKKQWALENLRFRNAWVLYVDADERLTPRLTSEIEAAVRDPRGHNAFWVSLNYVFLRKRLTHGIVARKVALLKRDSARFPEYDDLSVANMWEVEGHYQPVIDGKVGALHSRLLHDDQESLFHYFDRHNRYSDWEASVRANSADPSNLGGPQSRAKALFVRLPFRWAWLFCFGYIVKGGFLDGRAGLHYALAKAFYYWQVDVKSIELQRRAATNEPN
jgi:glycosyltransferase involved in cell wall biosynthesis